MISVLLKQLNKRRQIHVVLFFIFVFFGLLRDSYGWGNKKTHPALTESAVGNSVIDDY